MKLKKTYFTIFLFSLLLLVGFSPPYSNDGININFINNTAYADTLNDEQFSNAVKAYIQANSLTIANNEAALNTLTKNLDNSIGVLNKYLDSIFKAAELSMAALSVFAIAWIGFEYMTKGSGSLITYVKGREKLSNAFLAIVFVFTIPLFIDAVNNLTVTKIVTDAATNSHIYELSESGTKMADYFVTPSSSVKSMILNYASETSAEEDSSLFGEAEMKPKNGILKTIYTILMFILQLIYTPFHFLITLFGLIGFYPMSFDPAIYGEQYIHNIIPKFNLLDVGTVDIAGMTFFEGAGIGDDLSEAISSAVGNAFSIVIVVINLITGIIKKFCMIAIKGACYYYGFKVLTGLETTKVKDFLMRLLQGVLGMFAAPLIMQTLLDIDAMISTSILSLAGKSIPGVGMMNLILSPQEATANIINFVFAVGMLIVMFFITQAFLFRRLELIMYYLLAPPVFLKHIFQPQSKIVSHWFKTVASAAFVTTTYSPLFVLVQFLIIFGLSASGGGAGTFINQVIYYIIIWFIIFKGQNIVLLAVDLLFGGRSISDTMMRKKTQTGLAYAQNPMSTVGSVVGTGIGATHGALKSIQDAVKTEGGGIKGFRKAALSAGMQGAFGSALNAGLKGFDNASSNVRANSWYAQNIAMRNQMNDIKSTHGLGKYNKYYGELDGQQAHLKAEKDKINRAKRDNEITKNAIASVKENNNNGKGYETKADRNTAIAEEIRKHITSKDIDKIINNGIPAIKSDAKDIQTFFNGLNSDEVIKNTLTEMSVHGFDKSNPELLKSVTDMQVATEDFKKAQKDFNTASENNDAYGMSQALLTMNKSVDKLSSLSITSNLVKSMGEVSTGSNALDASSVVSAFSRIQNVDVAKLKAIDEVKNQAASMNEATFKRKYEEATGVKIQGDCKVVHKEVLEGKNEVFNEVVIKANDTINNAKLDFSKVSNGKSAGVTQAQIINNIDLVQKGQNKDVERIVVDNAKNSNLASYNATISNISNISNISDEIRVIQAKDANADVSQLENKLHSLLKQQGVKDIETVSDNLTSQNQATVNTQIVQMLSTDRAVNSIANLDKTVQKSLESAHTNVKSQSATLDSSIKSVNRKIHDDNYAERKLEKLVNSVGKDTFYKINPKTKNGEKYITDKDGNITNVKLEQTVNGKKIDYHQKLMNDIGRQYSNAQNAANTRPISTKGSSKGSKVDNIKQATKHAVWESFYEDLRDEHNDF